MKLFSIQLVILVNLSEAFLVERQKAKQEVATGHALWSEGNPDVQQLRDYVVEMKHVLDSAVTKISTLTDENKSLKTSIKQLQTRVQVLEDTSDLQDTNSSLMQKDIEVLRTRVEGVESKIGSELGSELQNGSSLEETVKQLQDDVGGHELDIAQVVSQSSHLEQSVQTLSMRLQNQTTGLREELKTMKQSNERELENQLAYIADQLVDVHQGVASLNTSLHNIHDTGESVAFLLQFKDSWVEHYREGTDMQFDHVIMDTARGYNSSSGVYRCPTTGLYLLALRCSTDWLSSGRSVTYASVYRNGQVLVSGTADEDIHAENDYVQIPVLLEAGEELSMRQDFVNASEFAGGSWTFFSGVLLHPKLSV